MISSSRNLILVFCLTASILVLLYSIYYSQKLPPVKFEVPKAERTWEIKSIDTMKFSRDLAQEKLEDAGFENEIKLQVSKIAESKATHIAIATPYDEKFYPFLERWVKIAREKNLKVWFRGNFSRWEGWFNEPADLTREEHIAQTRQFIQNHPDLFQDGDIFSPCPECENGGPGDPRYETGLKDFRKFITDEYDVSKEEFSKIQKDVKVLYPMNYDVASLVVDIKTADLMDNTVTIDHYVKDSQKLSDDIDKLHKKTSARVILGEFGAPLPDLHGEFTADQQASWVGETLKLLSENENLIGVNYWVSHGGSTALFSENGSSRPAFWILTYYYQKNLP
jgi:hypothetical protein